MTAEKPVEEKEINIEVGVNTENPNQTCTCKEGVNTCACHVKGITCQTENIEVRGSNSSHRTWKSIYSFFFCLA